MPELSPLDDIQTYLAPALAASAPKVPGLLTPGTIDTSKRPVVRNSDGSISTLRSMGVNIDGKELLIPTISPDGQVLSPEAAIKLYQQTGQHLGIFTSPAASTAFAKQLSKQQNQLYRK